MRGIDLVLVVLILVLQFFGGLEPDGLGDVVEFLAADTIERLAFGRQLFVDADGLFGHRFVSFRGAADEGKVGAGGQALMPVGVQTDAEHESLRFSFALFRHSHNLTALVLTSSGKKAGQFKLNDGPPSAAPTPQSRMPGMMTHNENFDRITDDTE